MKVILKQDVPSLGKKGAAVEVSEGYARNFLMPRALAVPASEAALKQIAVEQKAADSRKTRELVEAKELGEKLGKLDVVVKAKTGEGGRLFGSITGKDVADSLVALKFSLDKRKIELPEPIKQLGSYEVLVRLHPEVKVKLKVRVVAE